MTKNFKEKCAKWRSTNTAVSGNIRTAHAFMFAPTESRRRSSYVSEQGCVYLIGISHRVRCAKETRGQTASPNTRTIRRARDSTYKRRPLSFSTNVFGDKLLGIRVDMRTRGT